MTVVLDASALVAALVDSGPEGQWAESLIAGNDIAGPELAFAEVSNILRRLEQAGHISVTKAMGCHEILMQLDMELFPYAPYGRRDLGAAKQPDLLRCWVRDPGRGTPLPSRDS